MKRLPDRSGLARDLLPFAVVLAGIIGVLLATTFLYVRVSDGLRAYVNGESLWSKAQKEAVFELDEYAASGDPEDLEAYRQALPIPLAYRRARELLQAPELDGQAARRALLEGGSDLEDVSAMILVIRWFDDLVAVQSAIDTWTATDLAIVELQRRAERIRTVVEEAGADTPEATEEADELRALDARFTDLERRFSRSVAELDRMLSRSFFVLLSVLGLLFFAVGVGVALRLLKRIRASEKALRDREERLRLVVRATNDVLWDFDPRTGRTRWSDALESTLGYDPDRMDGDSSR